MCIIGAQDGDSGRGGKPVSAVPVTGRPPRPQTATGDDVRDTVDRPCGPQAGRPAAGVHAGSGSTTRNAGATPSICPGLADADLAPSARDHLPAAAVTDRPVA
jgi:hypothetical protein